MTSADADISIATSESGTGSPPVIFTHGWLHDRHVWDGVTSALSGRARCVTWDLRAHGESTAPAPGNYTRAHALEDLRGVVEAAGKPAILAGHSLGGYLSLAYTLAHPDEVTALILVAAGPGFRNPEAREQWNDRVRVTAGESDIAPGSEVISLHVDSSVIDNLDRIDVPVLVIVGEYDKRFQASAALFEKTLDVRNSLVIADAGHNVHIKKGPEIAAAIEDFLTQL